MRLLTAGAQLLSAQDANGVIFGSAPVQVNPGPAVGLLLATSQNVVAGANGNVTVMAIDAGANIAPTFAGTVVFAATDPNASLPAAVTFATSDHGQKTLSGNLLWRVAGTQTLTATSSGLTAGNVIVSVNAAQPAGLQIYGLGNLLAGALNHATVQAIDMWGNTSPSYTGTVTFSSSDGAATLPGATLYASGDAGSKNLPVRLFTAGAQSVTVADTTNGYSATQANVFVQVLRSRLVVTSPNSVTAGVPFALSVAATDAYNNLDTNYLGILHYVSTDTNAQLPGAVSFVASDQGQKTISNFVLTTASPNSAITVLNNANTIFGTTGAIAVGPANANRLSVAAPASVAAGSPLTATVTAYDAYANVATGYLGTVGITTNNANAVLPGPVAFASSGNGVLSIPSIYLLSAANNTAITATDVITSSIAGTLTGVQVTSLATDHFQLGGLTSGAAGHVNTLNVVARDIYNNVASSYRGSVTFTSSDAAAILPGNYNYIAGDQGLRSFAGGGLDHGGYAVGDRARHPCRKCTGHARRHRGDGQQRQPSYAHGRCKHHGGAGAKHSCGGGGCLRQYRRQFCRLGGLYHHRPLRAPDCHAYLWPLRCRHLLGARDLPERCHADATDARGRGGSGNHPIRWGQ